MEHYDSFQPYYDDEQQKFLLLESVFSLPDEKNDIIDISENIEDDEAMLREETREQIFSDIEQLLNQKTFDSKTNDYLKKVDRLTAIFREKKMTESLSIDNMISDEYDFWEYGLLPENEIEFELNAMPQNNDSASAIIHPEDIIECDEPVQPEITEMLFLKLCSGNS